MTPEEADRYYGAMIAVMNKKEIIKELRIIEKAIGSTDIRDISRALTSVWKLKKLFLAQK